MGRKVRAGSGDQAPEVPETCAYCGRAMPHSAVAGQKWCSKACRKHRLTETDTALETAITELLAARPATSSICPSEVARATSEDWRDLMEPTRRAARRLVARGEVEITQGGAVVDPSLFRGPIRIRLPRSG